MRFFSFSLFLAFAVSVIALTVTTPQNNGKVDLSKPFKIQWTTVNSDPERCSIFLVNSVGRNVRKKVAEDVQVSKSEFTLDPVWGVPKANGYQFDFISEKKDNTGILAQSAQFNVTNVAQKPKTQTPTPSATEPASTPTTTDNAGSKVLASFTVAGSLIMSLFALVM